MTRRSIIDKIKTNISAVLVMGAFVLVTSCYPDESVEAPIKTYPPSTDPIDIFIEENFTEKYGVAVRYKFVDRYVDQNKRVAPARRELVEPMLDFLTEFWIEPYLSVPNGRRFFENHVPAEVVLIGSPIFNDDETITLGVADAGARITLTEVNEININNRAWVFRQLGTIYHEFAHIVHQRYNLPPNWQEISPQGYTSLGSWYNLSEADALKRGFVSNYGTSTFNEDFAELIAFLLFDPDFYTKYIEDEVGCTTPDCLDRNEGRAKLRQKYASVLSHYKQVTGVNLLDVRAIIQDKLN